MWDIDLGIKHFFYLQRLAFRSIGFDITSLENTFQRPLFTGYLLLCTILLLSSLTYCSWYYKDDLEILTNTLLRILGTIISMWKLFTFINKRKELLELTERIWLMTQKATVEERLIVAAEHKIDKTFSSLYYLSVILAGPVISFLPLFITFFVFLKTHKIKAFLPVELSTPYDQTQPMYYLLTIICIASAIYFCGNSTVALDYLYSWFAHNIAAQFRVLQLQFSNAALMIDNTNYGAGVDIAVRRCIKRHQEVISLAEEFDYAFRPIIFVEFLLSGINIGLAIYQLGNGVPTARILFLLGYVCAVLTQLMIYCYGGQRIQDESQRLESHIYDVFPWHLISTRTKKVLQLAVLRAQRPCKITGIIFVANWPLFILVSRNTYSFIALLWTFVDKEK